MIGPFSHEPSYPRPALPNPEAYASALSKRASQAAAGTKNGTQNSGPAQMESGKVDASQDKDDTIESAVRNYYKVMNSSNVAAKMLRHFEKK